MKILVVSDSHGSEPNLRRAILSQPKAEVVIHLGDGEAEAARLRRSFPEKMFLQVRGNCDFGTALPDEAVTELDGMRIFYTHGHRYSVKSTMGELLRAAREREAGIVLYGHTHQAVTDYQDGLHIMNPGSLNFYKPTYGIIDIFPGSILTSIAYLDGDPWKAADR